MVFDQAQLGILKSFGIFPLIWGVSKLILTQKWSLPSHQLKPASNPPFQDHLWFLPNIIRQWLWSRLSQKQCQPNFVVKELVLVSVTTARTPGRMTAVLELWNCIRATVFALRIIVFAWLTSSRSGASAAERHTLLTATMSQTLECFSKKYGLEK